MSLLVTPGCRKATTRTAGTCNSGGVGAGRQDQSTALRAPRGRECIRPGLAWARERPGMAVLHPMCHRLTLHDDGDWPRCSEQKPDVPCGRRGKKQEAQEEVSPRLEKRPKDLGSGANFQPSGTSPAVSVAPGAGGCSEV